MAMDIRIGSLNCLHLSTKSDTERVSLIARIIIRERFDVVALQEVRSGGLDVILKSLNHISGGKWAGCSDNDDYAFVWNKEYLTLPKAKLPNGTTRTSDPHAYNQYKRDPELKNLSIMRPPFYGRFAAKV
jgi:hypothetical protein